MVGHLDVDLVRQASQSDPGGGNLTKEQPWGKKGLQQKVNEVKGKQKKQPKNCSALTSHPHPGTHSWGCVWW